MAVPIQKARTETVRSYGKQYLREVVRQITDTRGTGSLTIHYSQGHIGGLEWREHQVLRLTEPEHSCDAGIGTGSTSFPVAEMG